MRVRSRRPLLLVVLTLAIPAAHLGTAAAATSPREQTALLELFATEAALARAQSGAEAAHARLAAVRGTLASVRQRLGIARANELATQRALAARLNEIYRADPLDTLGVLLSARSFAQMSDGLDLLDRLSRQDSALVRSARRWHAALAGSSQRLRAAERRAGAVEGAWGARVAALDRADSAQRSLLARLQRQHVRSLKALTVTARRAVRRAHTVHRERLQRADVLALEPRESGRRVVGPLEFGHARPPGAFAARARRSAARSVRAARERHLPAAGGAHERAVREREPVVRSSPRSSAKERDAAARPACRAAGAVDLVEPGSQSRAARRVRCAGDSEPLRHRAAQIAAHGRKPRVRGASRATAPAPVRPPSRKLDSAAPRAVRVAADAVRGMGRRQGRQRQNDEQ